MTSQHIPESCWNLARSSGFTAGGGFYSKAHDPIGLNAAELCEWIYTQSSVHCNFTTSNQRDVPTSCEGDYQNSPGIRIDAAVPKQISGHKYRRNHLGHHIHTVHPQSLSISQMRQSFNHRRAQDIGTLGSSGCMVVTDSNKDLDCDGFPSSELPSITAWRTQAFLIRVEEPGKRQGSSRCCP